MVEDFQCRDVGRFIILDGSNAPVTPLFLKACIPDNGWNFGIKTHQRNFFNAKSNWQENVGLASQYISCTGWGQCIGTANRGYCKAGVKDTWKWY